MPRTVGFLRGKLCCGIAKAAQLGSITHRMQMISRTRRSVNGLAKFGGFVTAALWLTGCAHPGQDAIDRVALGSPQQWAAGSFAEPPDGWLYRFEDEQLPQLVAEAWAANASVQAAVARLEQSVATARMEGAARLPGVNLSGGAQRQQLLSSGDPVVRSIDNRYTASAVAQWELDLWGRVRSQAAAAQADVLAVESDLAALRLSLATRVAQAWFNVIEKRQQRLLAAETVASFEKNLVTVEERFERGLSPALDVRLTRANVLNVQATLARQQRMEAEAIRQLEVLLGRYPAGRIAVSEQLPTLLEAVPAGLPAQLLQRRPDLLAAQNRIIAADERLRESRASLLPAISLTASYGRSSADLEDLLKSSFDVWSIVGNLVQPIFQGGRLRANVERSRARLREVVAQYEELVLEAFREVETALQNEQFLLRQLVALEAAAIESTGAQQLAEERYERGLVDILTVLESQRSAFNSRSAALLIQNELLQNRLFLYRALGGDAR